jgi:hypothetical protein
MQLAEPFSEISQIQLAYDFIQTTGTNLFLTGKAGTGKTTFLRSLQSQTFKRLIITAPTGIAAINAGGVTIHSFFQLPFGPQIIPEQRSEASEKRAIDINKFSKDKISIIRNLDLLIIDEISMVRADLLDAVDRVLRRYRRRQIPFGGVQLLLIGDIQQLAPVVKEEDWKVLCDVYETPFFFSSKALAQTHFVTIELKHIFRQSDERFIRLLNQIRDNSIDSQSLDLLKSRYKPNYEPQPEEGYILLTTHNSQANAINERKLKDLEAPSFFFHAEISGVFPEYSYPTEVDLELKPGAQVMFARNDVSRDKRFYNGKIGTIESIDEETVTVVCPNGDVVVTEAVEWHNYAYTIDSETDEIRETLLGTFKQIPLKLAWAITIHKSQGLTFDKVVIDAHAAFAHGQVYVALSRCTSLEGVVLRTPIDIRRLHIDKQIVGFMQEVESNPPDYLVLQKAREAFQLRLLHELVDFFPLRQRMDALTKILRENEDIFGEAPYRVLKGCTQVYREEVLDVSRKFLHQIDKLLQHNSDAETNEVLQDRLKKGCSYFYDKTLDLQKTVKTLDPDGGTKALRKSMVDVQEKLEDELNRKLAALTAVREGFKVLKLTRALTSGQRPDSKSSSNL